MTAPSESRAIQTVPDREKFDLNLAGREISLFHISNSGNIHVFLTNYGSRIVSLFVPDKTGKTANVVLGYDSIQGYIHSNEPYFGATIGRFANRIANGSFKLNNKKYTLPRNEYPHHLHGGPGGLHSVVWDIVEVHENKLVLRYLSDDGANGYPGNLDINVSFDINNDGELIIDYRAKTDKTTIVNLTNHAFFNLSGAGTGSVADHLLSINADAFTPVDEIMIPAGEIKCVESGPFDFREERPIGSGWDKDHPQIRIAGGYDHNYVLNKTGAGNPEFAARVTEPVSGRILELETTEPGLQFYSANALDGADIGREGVPYESRTAFCLEPQHFPDSPNQPAFPGVILEPGEIFKSTSIYRFKI